VEKTLEFPVLLRLIDERSTAFRAAVMSTPGLELQVPTCPEWTLLDLVQHLGEVHRFWAAAVNAPGRTRPLPSTSTLPRAAPGAYRSPPTAHGPPASTRLAPSPPPPRARARTRPPPPPGARPMRWSSSCTTVSRLTPCSSTATDVCSTCCAPGIRMSKSAARRVAAGRPPRPHARRVRVQARRSGARRPSARPDWALLGSA